MSHLPISFNDLESMPLDYMEWFVHRIAKTESDAREARKQAQAQARL